MKTILMDGAGLSVSGSQGANGKNADGSPALQAWTFSSLDDAQKQRAEFEGDLGAALNDAAKAALDAHAAARADEAARRVAKG